LQSPQKDFPKLVIWSGDEEGMKVSVCTAGKIITGLKDFSEGILALVSIYLVFEIPVPLKYYKFVSILDCYCLGISTENTTTALKKYICSLLSR
jgi:hypothetical protein